MRREPLAGAAAVLALLLASGVPRKASAAEEVLDAAPMQGTKLRLDGLLREWPEAKALGQVLTGNPSKGDPKAATVLGYDADALYVALQVNDAEFTAGKDRAELELAFPSNGGWRTHTVVLEPGTPGKTAGAVKLRGRPVADSKLVEAPTEGGFTLEAKIPWSAFPEAAKTRVGLRGAVLYHDADAGGNVVIGTSKQRGGALPPLTIQAEYALLHGLVLAKGLPAKPEKEVFGNVAGDAMNERVAIFGRYLTVTGYHYRAGTEFFYKDLQVQEPSRIKLLKLVDFDGDGLDEVVVQRQTGTSGSGQDLLEIWRFPSESGAPVLAFQHEVGIVRGDNHVVNEVVLGTFKGKPALTVKVAKGTVDPKTWDGVTAGGETKPVLLPWQPVAARTYVGVGNTFELAEEKSGKPLTEPPPLSGSRLWSGEKPEDRPSRDAGRTTGESSDASAPAPKARPPTAEELMNEVYELYRTERGARGVKPRFDFATNVAADDTVERVVVHGKDLVVFGKKFLQGRSYAYTAVGVEKPEDVLEVNAMDLTGDGKAEILVHGVLRVQASKRLGGDTVTRHALFIYRVLESGIQRIFAAETGRAVGDDKVLGVVKFTPSPRAVGIELLPGRSVGWTESNYPFPEDRSPYGGLEPLLLPWTEQSPRVYRYVDGKYVGE